MICTFFGHRDTPDTVRPLLREVLLDLIEYHGLKQFYVGNQGNFDAMALRLLKGFEKPYSITYDVVLAYLPRKTDPFFETYYTILPEGIESVPHRFAIDYRNKWIPLITNIMLTQSLRELERSYLIERKNYDSIPPRVEYSLSERGRTLIPILKQIHEWGKDQMDLVVSEAKQAKK